MTASGSTFGMVFMKSLHIGEEYMEEEDYSNLGKGVTERYGMN